MQYAHDLTTEVDVPAEPLSVIAVDIGGTKIAAAVVLPGGRIVARASAPTPGAAGASAILRDAVALIEQLRGWGGGADAAALGVGSAGVIDAQTGRVLGATDTLAGWAGTDLRGELATRTGLPTAVVNDVHAHALGEAAHGAGRSTRTMLFIGVGTGIGGSFVIDGAVLPGAHSAAGHVGHQSSPYAQGLACTCGGSGHLEAIAAGPGLTAAYERAVGETVDRLEVVARRAGARDDGGSAGGAGDDAARQIIEMGGAAVGSAIGGLVNVLDPDVVVIGGGVSKIGDLWWDAVQAHVRREALPSLALIPVVPAELGTDAALVGAAELAWKVVS